MSREQHDKPQPANEEVTEELNEQELESAAGGIQINGDLFFAGDLAPTKGQGANNWTMYPPLT